MNRLRIPVTTTTRPLCRHLRTFPALRSDASPPPPEPDAPPATAPARRREQERKFPLRFLDLREAGTGKGQSLSTKFAYAYNPPKPPLSPLLDLETFEPYSKKHPKAPRTPGPDLSPREWALAQNPYAQILGSHIRLDADFHRRLPRSLLIRFTIKTEPVSQRPILLPEGIDYDKEILWNKNGAKYALATQFAIDIMTPGKGRGGKQWVKLVDESARQMMVASGIWRNDMATFIRDKIRKRVVAECGSNQISTRHDRVVGGLESWEKAGEVMCVLDFRRKGEKWVEDNDTLLNITEGGSWANREPPPKMDKDGLMTVVCGRRVPVHPMRKMLGDEMVEELMKNWQVEEGRPLMALMMTCRTTGMQEWLMKLRYYLGLWYAPEELQKEGKSEWGKDL